jgi:hypothetical protein
MSRSPVHKIYALIDPVTGVVCYVGQTMLSLPRRLADHINAARRGRPKHSGKAAWLCGLVESGAPPRIELLEECTGDWREAERRWMASFTGLYNAKAAGGGGSQNRLGGLSQAVIDQLGTVADSRIAESLGVTRKAVAYYRDSLGIPASFDRSRNTPPPRIEANQFQPVELPASCLARLGTMPDYKLAAEYGVSKRTIMRRRHHEGIPSYAAQTGNSGRIRVGEPHRRWTRGTELHAA